MKTLKSWEGIKIEMFLLSIYLNLIRQGNIFSVAIKEKIFLNYKIIKIVNKKKNLIIIIRVFMSIIKIRKIILIYLNSL